ncbi:MAG TPA: ATP-binding protein [bacterium]|nr:ATP-binding protein [bacterium]
MALSWQEKYFQALSRFLETREEGGLREAYELGRRALSEGTGLLDLVTFHHDAAARLAPGRGGGAGAQPAAAFHREALSPFEMIQRGYRETVQMLRARAEELRESNGKLNELNASLEERVAEGVRTAERRAKELARVNGELQQFVLVASHDLREPLRMIVGFVQLLEKRFPEKLDETSREYIHFAVDGAHRIQQLIEDLLAYTRIGGTQLTPKGTDLGEALGEALLNLKLSLEETGAEVRVDPLPFVMADRSLMVLIFQNLIGNAVKFRGTEKPRVRVYSWEEGGKWVIAVRDNGIGIDPRYSEKIFEVFQRLHSRDEYPGTGIGLALCRKVIEQHGGRIWVGSSPGKGSVFYFTLPKDMERSAS